MTTERELLELAASAAGLRVKREEIHGCYWVEPGQGLVIKPWHPGRDSADCAELETAVGLDIEWYETEVRAMRFDPEVSAFEKFDDHGGNKQKARMWATLRAAAEVGRRAK